MSPRHPEGPNNPRKKAATGKRRDLDFTNLHPAFRRMFDILSDGKQHLEVDVIASCAPLVAPNEAVRHMERQFRAQGREIGGVARYEKQAQGQRRKIQQKLRALERNGNAHRSDGCVTMLPPAIAAYQRWRSAQN